MTEVLKFGKKIFTASVVGTTMLWSVGVSALLPAVANAAVCPTLAAGDMIKVSGKPAIYSVNKDLKVLYFPSGDEFKSWNVDNSYGGYVTVTQECFDSLPVPSSYPGAVNYRAGSYVVKRPSSDQLYVVLPGNTLSKISTTNAAALYGASYKVMTVADAFWPHYVNRGADNAGAVHEGMLVKKDSKNWYVAAGNVLREVTATGMTANGFKSAFVRTVSASALAATTVGTQLAAEESVLKNRTQDGAIVAPTPGTTPPPVVGGNLGVTLAADNPAAANLADGSAYNSVLKLNLTASAATQVTGITLTKTGLIANTNISGVSVWDAQGNRHGDVMTSLTSDNKVTVSFGASPIVVPAGGSEALLVKINLAAAANSGLVGMKVAAATDVLSNGTVGGSFPVEGNLMSVIDGNASLASTTVSGQSVGGATTQPASTASGNINIGDVQKEVAKFRFTEQSGNEDVVISRLTFYLAGTIQDSDLTNFSVYAPDGTKLGTTAAMSNRYVTVNLTTPYTLPKSTNRDLSLKLDVVNGSTRNFNVHLQNDYDMLIKGVTTGFYILPSGFADTTSTSGWFNMGSGTLTVNKNTASPAGNVSAGASSVLLAKFDVKAVGENMELRKMGLGVNRGNGTPTALTGNVTVRDAADGTVYLTVAASTASLYTPTGAQNNLSNYINLTAGQTKSLEVIGNVDSAATSGVSYTVGIGNFYAKRASTLDFADNLPNGTNTSSAANQLTVSATSLTCNKDTSMGSVTRAPGATAVIGQYICTAGTSEDVRLSNVSVSFGLLTGIAANMFQNMSLWKGSTQLGSTISTVASTSNAFSMDLTIPKSGTVTLQLKALVVSGATGVVTSSFASYNYNGKSSGTAGTGAIVAGQQVTVGAGSVYISAVSDATTLSKVYGPGQSGVQLGKYKVQAANDDVTLSKITFTARNPLAASSDQTALGTFGSLSLYDGTTLLASGSYVAGDVVFTGFSSTIPMDSYKIYTLKGTTNGSGVVTNATNTAFAVKSDSNTDMEARSAAGALLGVGDISGTSTVAGNGGVAENRIATSSVYTFHDAYPTITVASVGTALPLDSLAKVMKFSVTNGGARDLRLASTTIQFNVSGLVGGTIVSAASGTISDFRLYEDNGVGQLGSYLAQQNTTQVNTTTANPVSIDFNADNDQNSLLGNFTIAPGATRTFIVTANTSNMLSTKTTGSVTLSAKISGTTGWSGTAWNTGSLYYFYTPVGGSENAAPGYSASDSYDVNGGTLSYTL